MMYREIAMSGSYSARKLRMALAAATALTALPAMARDAAPVAPPSAAPSLEIQFQNPPQSARPRVWWHWMNGNVTKDGIAKDFDWMQRVGIGGVQNFDANLSTPQIVEKRLVYMTPEWQDAFRFAAIEADRRGLELTIAASPGWSETGGPWVKPEDGLKKLVWSEAEIDGGKRFTGKLAAPPMASGPFQSVRKGGSIDESLTGNKVAPPATHYADVAVLAVPLVAAQTLAQPKLTTQDGKPVDPAALFDADLESAVEIARGTAGSPAAIVLTYPAPQTIRSASVFNPGAAAMFLGATVSPRLEASDDGTTWRKIADMPATAVPTTVSFAPVTSRYFRVVFDRGAFGLAGMSAPVAGADMSALSKMGAAAAGPAMIKVGDLHLSADARIDRFEAKAAFEVETDYYALSQGVPEAAGAAPGQVIDLTSRMQPDGTLDWTPPAGRWRILRMGYSLLGTTNHPAPPEATGLEVDKFDGPAVRRYLEHYIGMYRDAAGKELLGSRGVQAILTDSIEVGAANWTPRMVAQFKALRGYDPTPWLPALTGAIIGSRGESDKFLYDYRRTLADLMATEHYGTVAQVARENGLRVYGEALENGRPSLGDDMSMRRFADIPMSAMWTHTRAEGPRPAHVVDIKGAASVAHIYGQNLVAAESMTSALAPWHYAPNSLKRIIDLEFVNGVNRPIVHTSVHQPTDNKIPGLALFIFGQYFNRHEAWAELAKPWVDYMARNSLMLQQGRNVADVGYFYGEEAPLTALYDKGPVTDAPKAYAYDFVSQHALTNAMVNQGNELVTQGGARYRAIYLGGSSRRMTLPTLQRLAALVEGGATVIGKAPEGSPSLHENVPEYAALVAKLWPGGDMAQVGSGRVIASTDVEAALARIGVAPDFRYTGGRPASRIPFLHRQLADGDSYFIVNQTAESDTIEARFRVTGKVPELWRAETGKTEAVSYRIENGETIIPLTLASDESVHVVFRKPAQAAALAIKQLVPVPLAELSGAWTVAFQPGRGAPASAVLPALAPLNENANAGIKYFSGMATYTKDFAAPRGWKPGQPLWLDLGEAREVAEVLVNGQHAGYAWHAPYRVEIGAQVRRGRNQVTVRVANLWVNRLIGDAQPGAQKVTWTAMPTYLPNAALQPSGLIGPVTINGQGK
jgi:hypothetical protein